MIYVLKIAICDDNISTVEEIEKLVLNLNPQIKVQFKESIETMVFYSGETLIKDLADNHYDLILLDIEMKQLNGVEVGIHLREFLKNMTTQLIFISSYENYHLQLFDTIPSGFIKKPIELADFTTKITTAVARAIEKGKEVENDLLRFQIKGEYFQIQFSKIMYLESNRRKIILHTKNSTFEYYGKLSEEQQKLNSLNFIRIHQSYIINLEYLYRISNSKLTLANNVSLPISDKYSEHLHKQYFNYRGNLYG